MCWETAKLIEATDRLIRTTENGVESIVTDFEMPQRKRERTQFFSIWTHHSTVSINQSAPNCFGCGEWSWCFFGMGFYVTCVYNHVHPNNWNALINEYGSKARTQHHKSVSRFFCVRASKTRIWISTDHPPRHSLCCNYGQLWWYQVFNDKRLFGVNDKCHFPNRLLSLYENIC